MATKVIVCTFTSLDEVPRGKRGDLIFVGRVLAKAGRFSAFDAMGSPSIAATMDRLCDNGWFDMKTDPFPWTSAQVTPKGRVALGLEDD